MRTYVTILAGESAADARPVASSGHPEVVRRTIAAIRDQAKRETDRCDDEDELPERDGGEE